MKAAHNIPTRHNRWVYPSFWGSLCKILLPLLLGVLSVQVQAAGKNSTSISIQVVHPPQVTLDKQALADGLSKINTRKIETQKMIRPDKFGIISNSAAQASIKKLKRSPGDQQDTVRVTITIP